MKNFLITFLLFIIVLITTDCTPTTEQNDTKHGINKSSFKIIHNKIKSTETPTIYQTPTEYVVELIPQSTPLVFTFPTPQAKPISLWRPPLYDTPWALSPHDHFYFNRPIAADEINWPIADYRYGGIFFSPDDVHTGVDIPSKRGTPVLAAASGEVVSAGYGLYLGNNDPNDPYGLAVTIKHNFGYNNNQLYTVYAHMDRIFVSEGDIVDTGTSLGVVGDTGHTTGPHLHFEVRIDSNSYFATRNPELWLAPPQGWGVLVGRVLNTNGSLLTKHNITIISYATNQKWSVITYGKHTINSDEYYNENLVLSDLPEGKYQIIIDYLENRYISDVMIHPGAVSYFTFKGEHGYNFILPTLTLPEDWFNIN